MYPFLRLASELTKFRNAPKLGPFDTHISHHICWPWDLDPFIELNNGRTLTLYDLGRLPFVKRLGMWDALRANGWGITVAGCSVRYRRRVRVLQRFEMRTRSIGWDNRFMYTEQSMWRNGECLNHILVRTAATDKNGIVAPARLLEAMGHKDAVIPPLPDWVQAWVAAEAQRPWPPMADAGQ